MPPSLLLSLLEDPAPTNPAAPAAGAVGGATAAASGGAGGVGVAPYAPLPETVHTLVKDSVMTALVRLDDSEQVRRLVAKEEADEGFLSGACWEDSNKAEAKQAQG